MRECECQSNPQPGEKLINFICIIIFLPILSTIGIVTNMISLQIFMRPSKQSAQHYLAALSASDLGVCLTGIFVITADSLRAYNRIIDQIWVLLLPKLAPFGSFFQMLSIYLTIFTALDCYIGLSRHFIPIKKWYCTIECATKVVIGVCVFTVLYNFIAFNELESVFCFHTDLNTTIYELCPTELRINDAYVNIYKGYMYVIVMAFLPFISLACLTAGIITSLNSSNFTEIRDNNEEQTSPTTLILVIGLFLICSSVALVVNVCDMISGLVSPTVSMIMIDFGNILVVFNAAANFFIYFCSSRRYRSALKRMFIGSKSSETVN